MWCDYLWAPIEFYNYDECWNFDSFSCLDILCSWKPAVSILISSFLAFTVKPDIIYKETLKTTFVTTDISQIARCLYKMKSDVYTMEKW